MIIYCFWPWAIYHLFRMYKRPGLLQSPYHLPPGGRVRYLTTWRSLTALTANPVCHTCDSGIFGYSVTSSTPPSLPPSALVVRRSQQVCVACMHAIVLLNHEAPSLIHWVIKVAPVAMYVIVVIVFFPLPTAYIYIYIYIFIYTCVYLCMRLCMAALLIWRRLKAAVVIIRMMHGGNRGGGPCTWDRARPPRRRAGAYADRLNAAMLGPCVHYWWTTQSMLADDNALRAQQLPQFS